MTLMDAIKQSIRQYLGGTEVNKSPDAKYTKGYFDNFDSEMNGKATSKKGKTKVAKLIDKMNAS